MWRIFFDAEKLVEKVGSLLKGYPDVLFKIIRCTQKVLEMLKGSALMSQLLKQTQELENYAKSCGLNQNCDHFISKHIEK